MSVTIGSLMENGPKINNISKNALFNGFFVIPRSLYNSNMAKVFIVKWSQNMIFVDGSAISSTPKYFENLPFSMQFQNLGLGRKRDFCQQKSCFETTIQ